MNRRDFMSAALAAHAMSRIGAQQAQAQTNPQRPNIVFILADDLGYCDLSCYGRPDYTTPVLDKMAAEGMKFTDAHSSSAVCTPTRYSILTGRYNWRSRLKGGVLSVVGECQELPRDRWNICVFHTQRARCRAGP